MTRLGYHSEGDGFVPPAGHKALFLGDLIDTKPGHPFPGGVRATLRAVKDKPFNAWELPQDKSRWGSLPCSFL